MKKYLIFIMFIVSSSVFYVAQGACTPDLRSTSLNQEDLEMPVFVCHPKTPHRITVSPVYRGTSSVQSPLPVGSSDDASSRGSIDFSRPPVLNLSMCSPGRRALEECSPDRRKREDSYVVEVNGFSPVSQNVRSLPNVGAAATLEEELKTPRGQIGLANYDQFIKECEEKGFLVLDPGIENRPIVEQLKFILDQINLCSDKEVITCRQYKELQQWYEQLKKTPNKTKDLMARILGENALRAVGFGLIGLQDREGMGKPTDTKEYNSVTLLSACCSGSPDVVKNISMLPVTDEDHVRRSHMVFFTDLAKLKPVYLQDAYTACKVMSIVWKTFFDQRNVRKTAFPYGWCFNDARALLQRTAKTEPIAQCVNDYTKRQQDGTIRKSKRAVGFYLDSKTNIMTQRTSATHGAVRVTEYPVFYIPEDQLDQLEIKVAARYEDGNKLEDVVLTNEQLEKSILASDKIFQGKKVLVDIGHIDPLYSWMMSEKEIPEQKKDAFIPKAQGLSASQYCPVYVVMSFERYQAIFAKRTITIQEPAAQAKGVVGANVVQSVKKRR